MKIEKFFCDLCNKEITNPASLNNSEFKIKMKPDGGYFNWQIDEGQDFLELCDECEVEIMALLESRYNIGHGKKQEVPE